MHTKTCTRANSARSAVREMINNLLSEIGQKTRAHEVDLRKKYNRSLGIDDLDKKIDAMRKRQALLCKQRDVHIKADMEAFDKGFTKQRDRLCTLRSVVLFAKAQRLRELYEELSGS